MADPLTPVAETLYGLVPDEFTAARDRAVADARAAGDRALAARVKALRKPTAPAFAVNLLVRLERETVDQLVSLGAALREAQTGLAGEALRELTRQRRALVAATTARAAAASAERGVRLSEAARRQVEETLHAAMADPASGAAVQSGLLDRPMSSTGIGSLGSAGPGPSIAVDATDEATGSKPPTLTLVEDPDRRRREAEEVVEEAEDALRGAREEAEQVARDREQQRAEMLRLEAELEELRRRVVELEGQSEEVAETLAELDDDHEQAQAGVEVAQQQVDRAREALDRLP